MTPPLPYTESEWDAIQRRYTVIPDDLKRMAAGIDIRLSELRGSVRFWRDQHEKAKNAWQTNTNPSVRRRFDLVQNWTYCRKGLQVAEKRLAEYEARKREPQAAE